MDYQFNVTKLKGGDPGDLIILYFMKENSTHEKNDKTPFGSLSISTPQVRTWNCKLQCKAAALWVYRIRTIL